MRRALFLSLAGSVFGSPAIADIDSSGYIISEPASHDVSPPEKKNSEKEAEPPSSEPKKKRRLRREGGPRGSSLLQTLVNGVGEGLSSFGKSLARYGSGRKAKTMRKTGKKAVASPKSSALEVGPTADDKDDKDEDKGKEKKADDGGEEGEDDDGDSTEEGGVLTTLKRDVLNKLHENVANNQIFKFF